MNDRTTIKKVWLPTEMKVAVKELCWRRHTQPSPFLLSVIENLIEDPTPTEGEEVPPAGGDYLSVYLPKEVWEAGVALASTYGVRLSALVRVRLAQILMDEDIPWAVSPPRPQKKLIPILE